MKYLILILSLCSALSYGQPQVSVVIDSIVKRGEMRGVDIKPLIRKYVRVIYVMDTIPDYGPEVVGFQRPIGGGRSDLYILREITYDFKTYETVLAHEMAHAFGIEHCCADAFCVEIMTTSTPVKSDSIKYYIRYGLDEDEEIWDRYFDQIKLIK